MAISNCGQLITYVPAECESELGRIGMIALIDPCVAETADYSSCAWWTAQLSADRAIVIPDLIGSYDGGSHTTSEGYGRNSEYVSGMNHVVTLLDKTVVTNSAFWNALQRSSGTHHMVMFTATKLWPTLAPVKVKRSMPITTDLNAVIQNNITISWSYPTSPTPIDIPANCPPISSTPC